MTTEHAAWRETLSDTLPSSTRVTPVLPCDPSTMRSASHADA